MVLMHMDSDDSNKKKQRFATAPYYLTFYRNVQI